MMDNFTEQAYSSELLRLPYDILSTIFMYCDTQSLGRLARTCKTFKNIIYTEDYIWKERSKAVFGSNMAAPAMQMRCKPILSYKNRCRISTIWYRQLGNTTEVARYKKCMPWILLEQDYLFCSIGKCIMQYTRDEYGNVYLSPRAAAFPSEDDVSKFSVNENEVVCAGRDGKMTRIDKKSFKLIQSVNAHSKDILTIDSSKDIIVTGSIDSSVKVWKRNFKEVECKKEINILNRVLATSILPSNVLLLIGTPGTKRVHPLQLFDIESGIHITNFGEDYRYGAGILDFFCESPNLFYSCGYDTTLRLWDIRSPNNSVLKWIEPFDSALYCIETDYNVTIVTGTARNGSFLIWDKRINRQPVKHYFIPSGNTQRRTTEYYQGPVYSVAFDASHIYVAFEKTVLQYSYF